MTAGPVLGYRPPRSVDRFARDQLAEQIRHFAAGRITNDQYEDATQRDAWQSNDPALRPIWWQTWTWYSDTREYRLAGQSAMTPDGRRYAARLVVFLQSDLPYEWPRHWALVRRLCDLVTPGLARRWSPSSAQSGDRSVWPFFRKSDLAVSQSSECQTGTAPKCLSGFEN